MENMGMLHPEAHIFFIMGITRHGTDVVGAITTQILLKEGLKRWGEKVIDAIHSEMKQQHMRYTSLPILWNNM